VRRNKISEIIHTFLFHCQDSILDIDDRERYKKVLQKFNGKDGFITIEPIYKQRTIPENRYFFGVVIPTLINETEMFGGWDKIEVYRWLEWKFLNDNPLQRGWVLIKKLSTKDFEKLMTRIRDWASMDLGAYIPEPNEVELFGEIIL